MDDRMFLAPGATQVFERLSEEIAGNDALRGIRGSLGTLHLGCRIDGLVRSTDSPTGALAAYDEMSARHRVLVNFLAKVRRDHGDGVYKEVDRAFRLAGRLMPGEKAAETEDWSLVAFEPKTTFGLIAFGLSGRYADMRRNQAMEVDGLPSLPKYTRRVIDRGAYYGWELAEAWRTDVARPHAKRITKASWYDESIRLRLRWRQRMFRGGGGRDGQPFGFNETEISEYDNLFSDAPYLLLVRGDGEEVRRSYKHPDWRGRVGIWTVPIAKGCATRIFGIHSAPICRHETWRRLRPNNCSQGGADELGYGTIYGLGAVAIDTVNVSLDEYQDGSIVPLDEGAETPWWKFRLMFGPP